MRRAMTIVGTLTLALTLWAVPATAAPTRSQPARPGRTAAASPLRVSVGADVARAWPGRIVDYTIQVRNRGRTAVTGAVLTARIASGAVIVGISDPGCHERSEGRVACSLPSLPAGRVTKIVIAAVVRPEQKRPLRTQVAVAGARATALTPLRLGTDLVVRLRHARRHAVAVTVVNRGPRTAHQVRLYAASIQSRVIRYAGGRCSLLGHRVRCRLGRLRPGTSRTIRLTTRGGGPFAATVAPEAGDPRPADNTSFMS